MNKKLLHIIKLIVLISIVFYISSGSILFSDKISYAEENNVNNSIIEEQSQLQETKKIEEELEKYYGQGFKEILPELNPDNFIENTSKGKFNFNIGEIFNRIVKYLVGEIYQNIGILIKLIVLVVLCAILRNLQSSFLSESVGELAFFTCYIVIISILIFSFNSVLNLSRDIIDNMVTFMHATIPVLITLLVSSGNITSGGAFQPILIMIVEISATVMKNLLIPMILFSTILSLVNNISDKIQVSKMASFLKQITTVTLGFFLTVFIAVITIHGSVGAVVDGVTSKTAKFAISTFIPVAGKYLADAADTVIGCTLLIKNASGIAVMIGIISICLIPILKIVALIALYKITCVIIEPVAEKRIVNCINDITGSLTVVTGIVASIAFMFLIAVTAIISSSNISAAIR